MGLEQIRARYIPNTLEKYPAQEPIITNPAPQTTETKKASTRQPESRFDKIRRENIRSTKKTAEASASASLKTGKEEVQEKEPEKEKSWFERIFAPADAQADFGYASEGLKQLTDLNEMVKAENEQRKLDNTAAAQEVRDRYALMPAEQTPTWTPQESTGNRFKDLFQSGVGDMYGDMGYVYTPVNDPTKQGRVANTIAGGGKGFLADAANAISFALSPEGAEQGANELDAIFGTGTGGKIDAIPEVVEFNERVSEKLGEYSSETRRESQDHIALAKDGLGTFGSLLVDAGVAGTQMAMDYAVTGGKGALLSMGVRSFGGGVAEAESMGVTDRKAIADYAVGSAAVEILTEKIGGIAGTPFKKVYGAGAIDDIIKRALQDSCKTATGRAALTALISGLSEGGEEMLSSLLNPILKSLTITPGASYSENFDAKEMLYSGLVGALTGVAGGTGGIVSGVASDVAGGIENRRLRTGAETVETPEADNSLPGNPTAENIETDTSENIKTGITAQGGLTGVSEVSENSLPENGETVNVEQNNALAGNELPSTETVTPEVLQTQESNALPGNETENNALQTGSEETASAELESPATTEVSEEAPTNEAASPVSENLWPEAPTENTPIENVQSIEKRNKKAFRQQAQALFPTAKRSVLNRAADDVASMLQNGWAIDVEKIQEAFDEIWENSEMTVEALAEYKDAAQAMKGRRVYVNDSVKSEIGDDWKSVAASARRLGVTLTTKADRATGVDVFTQEMAESHPRLFDAQSTDGTEMVYNILDVLQKSKDTKTALPDALKTGYGEAAAEEARLVAFKKFMDAAQTLYNDTKADREARHDEITRRREEAARLPEKGPDASASLGKASTPALKKIGADNVSGAITGYGFVESAVQGQQAKRRAERSLDRALKRLNPTDKEKRFAQQIATGDFGVEDIPATMSSEKVTELAQYYEVANSYDASSPQGLRSFTKDRFRPTLEKLFENANDWTTRKTVSYVSNTMIRNMERMAGKEQGKAINEVLFYPIEENSAKRINFVNDHLDKLGELKLTASESELTQKMLEYSAAGEQIMRLPENERTAIEGVLENKEQQRKLGNWDVHVRLINSGERTLEGYKADLSAEDFAKLSQYYDLEQANGEFNLSAEQAEIAERYMNWQLTQTQVEQADAEKINKAVELLKQEYADFYAAINDHLVAHGYEPIGFIEGYAPHMQPDEAKDGLSNILERLGIAREVTELPTSIAGRTDTFKPGKQWVPNFLTRNTDVTEYDAVKGFQEYVNYISNVLYHTDDIQKLRQTSNYFRERFTSEDTWNEIERANDFQKKSTEEKNKFLHGVRHLENVPNYSDADATAEIERYKDELLEDVKNMTKFGEFVTVLEDYTNKLAGKQVNIDRAIEKGLLGRKALNAFSGLSRIFGEAAVVGNLSSALNQLAQLPLVQTEVGNKYVGRALLDIMQGKMKGTDFDRESSFITGKLGTRNLLTERNRKELNRELKHAKTADVMAIPFEAVDNLASRLMVRAKYLQQMDRGKSHDEALREADRFASRIVGSRVEGARPMLFENKTLKLFTTFQLEIANAWAHITQDLPADIKETAQKEGKKAAVAETARRLTTYSVNAFLLNQLATAVYGGTPAPFDVIGYILGGIAEGYGTTASALLADIIAKVLGQDDDDEEEEFDLGAALSGAGELAIADVPYVRNVASMFGVGDSNLPMPTIPVKTAKSLWDLIESTWTEEADSKDAAWGLGKNALQEVSSWFLGGNQIKKSAQGIITTAQHGRYSGTGDNKQLMYPVDTSLEPKGLLTGAQAVLFGRSALGATDRYYAEDAKKLTVNQTQAYEAAVAAGDDRNDVYDTIQTIRGTTKTDDKSQTMARMEVLKEADLSDEAKRAIYEGVISTTTDHSEEIDNILNALGNTKLTFNDYLDIRYKYTELYNSDGKAAAKTVNFANWLNRQGYSASQQAVARDEFTFYQMTPGSTDLYDEFVSAGIASTEASQIYNAISTISAETTAGKYDRYNKAVQVAKSDKDALAALSALMPESTYGKLEVAYDYGVSASNFLNVYEQISNLDSKSKSEVQLLLNGALSLNNDERAVMWQLTDKRWKAYNNPYNTSIGQELYNLLNA